MEEVFGAPDGPAVSWDFGDGSPVVIGRQVRHAFVRSGRYQVRALDGAETVASQEVEVVPRSLLRAVPSSASALVYLPALADDLSLTVDFLERLFGAESTQRHLEESYLPAVAMELSASQADAVDSQEGLGLFTLTGFDGTVALLGVADGERALAALVRHFEAQGGTSKIAADGTVWLREATGAESVALLDRGYLYWVGAGSQPLALSAAVAAVRTADAKGLEEKIELARARARVAPGDAYVFVDSPSWLGANDARVKVFFASLAIGEHELTVDGFFDAGEPLWASHAAVEVPLLRKAPEGPVAAAVVSVPPSELARLLVGEAGTQRRLAADMRFRRAGLDLEELLAALVGDVAALAYFDAEAFFDNLVHGSERPEPRGTVWVEAGLSRDEPVAQLIEETLDAWSLRHDRVKEKGFSRYRTRLSGQSLDITLTPRRARLVGGTEPVGRAEVDLASQLVARFGGGAFSSGHVSLMVDLGQLRKELEHPRQIPGVDARRLVTVQGFSAAFLAQLTPVDHAFLDLGPEEGGARLQGRLVLRRRQTE